MSTEAGEGHTSLVKELKRDQKEKAGVVVLSVGGKGLLNAMVEGLRRAGWADVPVVAMETEGAHSLKAAMNAGRLVTLPAVTSTDKTTGGGAHGFLRGLRSGGCESC
nr:L-serine dehydratase/L-threonine deaminase-like isoform X1 [Nothobranchius furzeri]XP_054587357.1 L-serine dehydratase/L-threonine deaminase-like isoform X1 [Nothobranchius furzeri]